MQIHITKPSIYVCLECVKRRYKRGPAQYGINGLNDKQSVNVKIDFPCHIFFILPKNTKAFAEMFMKICKVFAFI